MVFSTFDGPAESFISFIALACPKLQAPENGYLVPHTCATGKTFPGQQCLVRCKAGHRLVGSASPYQCLPSQQWRNPDETPRCDRVGNAIAFILKLHSPLLTITVIYKQIAPCRLFSAQEIWQSACHLTKRRLMSVSPNQNPIWIGSGMRLLNNPFRSKRLCFLSFLLRRYVDSEPLWAKQLGGELPVGLNSITFRVRSPVSDLKASCTFSIEVFGRSYEINQLMIEKSKYHYGQIKRYLA